MLNKETPIKRNLFPSPEKFKKFDQSSLNENQRKPVSVPNFEKDVNNKSPENSPKKESPIKYAGGGYTKSPNPKSLVKPSIQSPTKMKRESNQSSHSINHSISAPILTPSHPATTQTRYDANSFFRLYK